MALPAGEGGEHLGERDRASLGGDGDPEVEPVVADRGPGGRHLDRDVVADLAVLGHRPGALDPDVIGVGEHRERLGDERGRVQSDEPVRAGVFRRVDAELLPVDRETVQDVQNRVLGLVVPERLAGRGAAVERDAGVDPVDVVGPLPAQGERVLATERRQEHQDRGADPWRRERAVGRGDPPQLGQPRGEARPEPVDRVGGDGDVGVVERGLPDRPGDGRIEVGQCEAARGGGPVLRGGHGRDAVRGVPAEERDRHGVVVRGVGPVEAQDRADRERAGVGAGGDVEGQRAVGVARERPEPVAGGQEAEVGVGRGVEQRPEPGARDLGEVDLLLVGPVAEVPVGREPGAGSRGLVEQVELADQGQVVGTVLRRRRGLQHPVPQQPAVHPAVAPGPHQAPHQPAGAVGGQLDREGALRPGGRIRRFPEQRLERGLPGRRRGDLGDGAGGHRAQRGRRDVLAQRPDRARALAVGQREAAVRVGVEVHDGRVDVALPAPDHGPQLPDALAPLREQHGTVAGVAPSPLRDRRTQRPGHVLGADALDRHSSRHVDPPSHLRWGEASEGVRQSPPPRTRDSGEN